jgi:hypothetical protein
MLRPVCQAASLAVLLCLMGYSSAADDPLPREAIARRAKASTALVELKPGYGSGFCVHSSGLFVTNEHVIRPPFMFRHLNSINVVLDAGLKTQKVLKAKVLRSDKGLDLALLKVDGTENLEALELGSDRDLGELTELIACGFPFGQALARPGEYPAISINAGSVTSLRRDKDGELHRIQLDAALNPGNSGGPVLDRKGKVVGMVVSGIKGSGVNLAIPVSHLQRFLAPEVILTLPAIKAANQNDAFEFRARTISLLPTKEALDLELVLGAAPGKERRFPMKLADGAYRAKAVPFPAREGPPNCRVQVKYADGSVSGDVEDKTYRLGDKEIKLSQLRHLRLGPRPEARLGDGQRLEGKPVGLEVLSLKVGKQSLRLDLTSALEVNVEAPEEPTAISCTIVTRQAGREVGRKSEPLYIEGVSRTTFEALADGKFVKPVRSGAPASSLRIVSSSKLEYVGQGQSYSYSGDDLTVQVHGRGVTVQAEGFGGWILNIGGPGNRFLDVGEYEGAKRFPFSGDAPGLEFSGKGRGLNTIIGKFVVWEIEVNGNQVVRLAIDFIQRNEAKTPAGEVVNTPPLYGSLRINSSFH